MEAVLQALMTGPRLTPAEAGRTWPSASGIYAFFVDTPESLPAPFSTELQRRGSDLLYIGKADTSLRQRGFEEELRHRRAATFFRSLGAVLGHMPEPGSLAGCSNQNNYRFSPQVTAKIVEWIDAHLRGVAVAVPATDIGAAEPALIAHAKPLLNIQHNPVKLPALVAARDRCRTVARHAPPNVVRSYGSSVDRETWTSLLSAVPSSVAHAVWCAVIREIAVAVAEQRSDQSSAIEEAIRTDAELEILDWQNSSMPIDAPLAGIPGEHDYFRELGLSWDERIQFVGQACGYATDVVDDLKVRLDGHGDAQDSVTLESVEDFYVEWRSRFLERVRAEAQSLRDDLGADR